MSQREFWIPAPPVERVVGRRCGEHGCVGPFVNQLYEFGLGSGTVFGDCVECGRRGLIRQSHRGFESIGKLVEAVIPPAPAS
jgi:hypothetical protein